MPSRARGGRPRPGAARSSSLGCAARADAFGADDRVGSGGGGAAERETITMVEAPLAEFGRAALSGTLCELKLLVLVQAPRLRRPDLFA